MAEASISDEDLDRTYEDDRGRIDEIWDSYLEFEGYTLAIAFLDHQSFEFFDEFLYYFLKALAIPDNALWEILKKLVEATSLQAPDELLTLSQAFGPEEDLPVVALKSYRYNHYSELIFNMSKLRCSLNGYSDDDVRQRFCMALSNLIVAKAAESMGQDDLEEEINFPLTLPSSQTIMEALEVEIAEHYIPHTC